MMKKVILCAALGLLVFTGCKYQTEVIAHRGYWTAEGSYENTISALQNALSLGAWGSEFDVWITADSVAVIHHNHITASGLVIEESLSDSILAIILPNGEKIPTLEQYLDVGAKGTTKLILEIKPHSTPEKDRLAAAIAINTVVSKGLQCKTEYISFSRVVCDEVVRLAPGVAIAYLEGDMSPVEVKKAGYTGIDYSIEVLREHPEWFEAARKEELTTNVWTVNAPEDMQYVIDNKVDFITTNYPVEAMELVIKK